MFFISDSRGNEILSGHIGTFMDPYCLNLAYEFQADCDELLRACAILGRPLPPKRVFKFYGNDLLTIINNWS